MGSLFSRSNILTDPSLVANKSYDYVVIGSGTAGCVVASRLSENSDVTVLLVEAGSSNADEFLVRMPVGAGQLRKTSKDWCYTTVPQPALNDRKIDIPRGKLLGGSGSMNAIAYQHGSPSDFDEWAAKGATSWDYKSMVPYFRKSEKFTPHALHPDVKVEERGDAGLWQTSYGYPHTICDSFVQSAVALGIPYNPDTNTPRGSIGVGRFILSIDQQGRRSSTATAFLSNEVLQRKNLTVVLNTLTTKIVLSSDARPRAIGIEVTKNSDSPRYSIAVRKEVLLCAGAINSPQLLMLSGIGPKEELEKHNIPLVKDLSWVGKNLKDHPLTPVICRAKNGLTLDYLANPLKALPVMLRWAIFGTGPAATPGGEAALFVRSDDTGLPFGPKGSAIPELINNASGPDAPDIEIGAAAAGFWPLPKGSSGLSIIPILPRQMSTGCVYLASASPFDKPLIDPRFMEHPNDMQLMVRAIRLCLRIARTGPLKDMLLLKDNSTDTKDLFWPGDADPDLVTDADLEAWVRDNVQTTHHAAGTVKMGPSEDDGAVDPQLRIIGVDGLRVVDASIFPTMISGHPTAAIVAVAEKASDMILNGLDPHKT